MIATNELRCMLDARGVEHRDHYLSTTWRDEHGVVHLAGEPMADGSLVVDMLTPAQAIAATLGAWECEIVEHYVASTRGEVGRERVKLSCGHIVERHSKYCQECGCKIRKAVKR